MDFTGWLESLKILDDVVGILAGLGLVAIFLGYFKHTAERRCWRNFKKRVHDWVDQLLESESRHPNEIQPDEWKVECERMLTDANFSPLQIRQVLDVSVVVAKGITADKVFN